MLSLPAQETAVALTPRFHGVVQAPKQLNPARTPLLAAELVLLALHLLELQPTRLVTCSMQIASQDKDSQQWEVQTFVPQQSTCSPPG
jgi:hypothetical protein